MKQEEHYYLGEKLHTEVLEEKYGAIRAKTVNSLREIHPSVSTVYYQSNILLSSTNLLWLTSIEGK